MVTASSLRDIYNLLRKQTATTYTQIEYLTQTEKAAYLDFFDTSSIPSLGRRKMHKAENWTFNWALSSAHS